MRICWAQGPGPDPCPHYKGKAILKTKRRHKCGLWPYNHKGPHRCRYEPCLKRWVNTGNDI